MRAGDFDAYIQVQPKVYRTNDQDQVAESWGASFSLWADAQRSSEQNARFVIWHRDDIRPGTHRILYFGCYWTITNAIPDKRNVVLIIDSDFSAKHEITDLQSTEREYIDGLPIVNKRIE